MHVAENLLADSMLFFVSNGIGRCSSRNRTIIQSMIENWVYSI